MLPLTEHAHSTLTVHASVLGCSSLSLARASSKLALLCRSCRCSPMLYVVRCTSEVRSDQSYRGACQYQTARSTFLFFFFVISSMLASCCIHRLPRPPAQYNCGNIGMGDDAGYFSVRSPARPGWPQNLVSRATVKINLYQRKKSLHRAQKERKTS